MFWNNLRCLQKLGVKSMNQKIGVSSYTSLHAFQEEQNKLFSLSSHTYLAAANKTRIQSNLWLVAEWQNNRLNKRVCVLFLHNPALTHSFLKLACLKRIKFGGDKIL